MNFPPVEQAAVDAHAAALGMTRDDYVRRSAADRALTWQHEQEAFGALAERRGCSVEELLKRGVLTDGLAEQERGV